MRIQRLLVESASSFAIALVVTALVSWLWSSLSHRASTIDWETSFRFAIVFAILTPWIGTRLGRAH